MTTTKTKRWPPNKIWPPPKEQRHDLPRTIVANTSKHLLMMHHTEHASTTAWLSSANSTPLLSHLGQWHITSNKTRTITWAISYHIIGQNTNNNISWVKGRANQKVTNCGFFQLLRLPSSQQAAQFLRPEVLLLLPETLTLKNFNSCVLQVQEWHWPGS